MTSAFPRGGTGVQGVDALAEAGGAGVAGAGGALEMSFAISASNVC